MVVMLWFRYLADWQACFQVRIRRPPAFGEGVSLQAILVYRARTNNGAGV
jgi:hypothetical protein